MPLSFVGVDHKSQVFFELYFYRFEIIGQALNQPGDVGRIIKDISREPNFIAQTHHLTPHL
ncbi:hypothetical protein D3C84_1216230 [compost metagenome]